MTDDLPGQLTFDDMTADRYTELVTHRNQLAAENEALRKLRADEAIINRRLTKELRDLKATLDASQAHDGQWLV